jgi:hypothetical protein
MIKLDTVLNVGKTFTAKATKDESKVPVTVAQIKFSDLQIDRDTIDELLGETIGWCRGALYDDLGAPRKRYGITVFGRAWRVSGGISGPKQQPTLPLLQAELSDAYLTLMPLGALLEGKLTWSARGDEVEDISELLGNLCTAKWEITEGEQADLFAPTSSAAAAATTKVQQIIDGLGRNQPGAAQ